MTAAAAALSAAVLVGAAYSTAPSAATPHDPALLAPAPAPAPAPTPAPAPVTFLSMTLAPGCTKSSQLLPHSTGALDIGLIRGCQTTR